MTRSIAVALVALCLALAGVALGTYKLVRQARAELLVQLEDSQRRQVDELARLLQDDIDHVGSDLRLVGNLVVDAPNADDRRDEIAALVTSLREYRMAAIFDASGTMLLSVTDPGLDKKDTGSITAQLLELAAKALALPAGHTAVTQPFDVGPIAMRGFALSLPTRHAGRPAIVAIAVDTNELFAKLRLLTADNASRVILLGSHGLPTSATDPALAAAINDLDRAELPDVAGLIGAMREGKRGLRHLGAADARRLDLADADAVAAFAPVNIDDGGHWSVATLSSTAVYDAHERALVGPVAVAAFIVSMLLIGFGGYLVVSQRRAVVLRERLQASEALARAHARTQHVIDNLPTGVITCSIDGCVLAVNQTLTDRIPASAIGSSLAAALPEAPRALVRVLDALLGAARASEQPQSLYGEAAALFGEEGCYNLHAVPLDLRSSDPRLLLVIEDVSRVQALESQLLRAEKLVTVGELAAGMAHEVGTPLGVVRGRAEYVMRKLGADHPQAQSIGDIVEQIDHVTRTIRQLLDFSRVSPAVVQPVSVTDALRSVSELMRFEAERRKIAIAVEAPADLEPALADPDQLQQVLVNLTKNALDASEAGSAVTLRAGREASGGVQTRLRIDVEDRGCGISASDLHRIFDPFYTTKKRGQGTGLGLAVTAQIVRNHGAEIRVDSEEGRGSCISLLWPTAAQEERRSHGG
jgi:signal transduction histidine kinase